jgi:hypothetical protein
MREQNTKNLALKKKHEIELNMGGGSGVLESAASDSSIDHWPEGRENLRIAAPQISKAGCCRSVDTVVGVLVG